MNPINPLKHAMELDAERYGYENAEEYMKEYGKVSLKAVQLASEVILLRGSGKLLTWGSKLPMVTKFRKFIWKGLKKIVTKALNTAKSAWNVVIRKVGMKQSQEVIKRAVECGNSMIPVTLPVPTPVGYGCAGAQKITEAGKKLTEE